MLNKAIILATRAHQGMLDKEGNPYIFHSLRVMMTLEKEDERVVAILHDVLKNTDLYLSDLICIGLNENQIRAIEALTRARKETYNEYIDRISENEIATKVKIADLIDNMNVSKIPNPTKKDYDKVKKYKKAYKKLIKVARRMK